MKEKDVLNRFFLDIYDEKLSFLYLSVNAIFCVYHVTHSINYIGWLTTYFHLLFQKIY